MSAKVGRNDPCPCGSGKKYKHCCLSKDNVFQFTGNNGGKDKFAKYQAFVESHDPEDGHLPSFMEWQGKPNPATDDLNSLKSAMEKMDFKSKEEMQAFIDQHIRSFNDDPLGDFLGLSPAVMRSILTKNFSENTSVIELSKNIPTKLLEEVSVLKQCRYILQTLSKSPKGIKSTQAGNFPRQMVQEFYAKFIKEQDKMRDIPMKEDDTPEIQRLRFFLEDAHLIRKEHGYIILTKKGKEILPEDNLYELYKSLFRYFSESFNWLYATIYPDALEFIQDALVFNLYILKHKGRHFISGDKLAEIFKTAFPQFGKDVSSAMNIDLLNDAYCYIFLDIFALSLGLVEKRRPKGSYLSSDSQYKVSGLFERAFEWKV